MEVLAKYGSAVFFWWFMNLLAHYSAYKMSIRYRDTGTDFHKTRPIVNTKAFKNVY